MDDAVGESRDRKEAHRSEPYDHHQEGALMFKYKGTVSDRVD